MEKVYRMRLKLSNFAGPRRGRILEVVFLIVAVALMGLAFQKEPESVPESKVAPPPPVSDSQPESGPLQLDLNIGERSRRGIRAVTEASTFIVYEQPRRMAGSLLEDVQATTGLGGSLVEEDEIEDSDFVVVEDENGTGR